MKNIFIYSGLLLLMFLTLVGCGPKVGDCLYYANGVFHVVKVKNGTVELINLKTNELGYDVLSKGEVIKVDCSIAHEVIESNREKK